VVEEVEVVETDVLVIGGGAAGANAAVKAADQGARVVLVVKGLLGKSGCSIFASHIPYHDISTEQKSRDRLAYAIRYYNHYLTDQEYCKRASVYMRTEFFVELERLGIYWRRDGDKLNATAARTPTLVAHKQGASGVLIMDKRRRQIFDRAIPVYEECAVTSLLQDNGRVVGATVLDLQRGRFFAVSAKAVVLAAGHSDYLSTRSTGTREQSADGVAMAIRAGAEVANLEIQWWHISDVLAPKSWMRYHIYPNPLMGTEETSRVYNSDGEMFFEQKTHNPGTSAPYIHQLRLLAQQVKAGKARWDGGYYSGFTHIPADTVLKYQHQAKIWGKLGLDVGKDLLECGITWHMRQGGINVSTERMESNLPGLFIAGGLGAHYLGGVGPSSYDGKVAGESAAALAAESSKPAMPRAMLDAEQRRVFGFLKADSAGVRPMAAKLRIRELMWELGYVKNEQKLNAALDGIVAVREQMVPKFGLQSASRAWNTGWMDALDACSMIDATEAMVRSALLRKESRGPFYREDYPYVDNENWLRKIILTRDGNEWKSRTEPYALPYLKPEKSREPFFEADF